MTDAVELDINNLYSILATAQAGAGSSHIFLGRKHVCRYCGCTDPKQFQQEAHLVPEGLGNKWIISLDECDRCNGKFSIYETNLIAALRPILTIGGTTGKGNKVGQTGRTGGKTVIMHGNQKGNRGLTFLASDNSPQLSVNPISRDMRVAFPVSPVPFRPRLAYKALVKIGYALLPERELQHFTKLRHWLSEPHDGEEFPCLEVGIAFGSLGNAPKLVSASLLRRNNDRHHLPYMLLTMCVGSICLQIDLMSDDKEDHLGWAEMGQVKINWTVVLGPNREIRIDYGRFTPFNWSSASTVPQPIKELILKVDLGKNHGHFAPVLRDQ